MYKDYVNESIGYYIHISKYSKWLHKEKRRELTWIETVDRLRKYWEDKYPEILYKTGEFEGNSLPDWELVCDDMYDKEVMPSMRSLMTAGPALDRDNVAGFNCAAIAVNHMRVFDEIFYLLMCGTGVGFSVERQYINKLPDLPEKLYDTDTVIKVRDSKLGWAKALKELVAMLYNGDIPKWDLSSVRPSGARLKTFGGRASGPDPLDRLLCYTVDMFSKAVRDHKTKLNSLECHDLICKIADTVIVGSVRRSACISLSNLTDSRMSRAKRGDWYTAHPERALANNSVAYTEKPDLEAYFKEMRNLLVSKAGERGIINKEALRAKAESCGRDYDGDYLLNPCGEAILRDNGGLCNLTEVVIRPEDDLEDLIRKVRHATILGTLQATLVDFRYLRKCWEDNQREERLLGVSLTGIMDHPIMSGKYEGDAGYMNKFCGNEDLWLEDILKILKEEARSTNEKWSEYLDIPTSKQLTLIKPSGTVSKLVGCSPGMHPRPFKFYFQRLTQDTKDPLTTLMKEEGIPYVVRGEKTIFSFPVKSPEGATTARDITAIEQLKLWKVYREHWCDGNPSQTIYYTDDDFPAVVQWVWENWDIIGGLSFFPLDNAVYDRQTQPWLEVTEQEYEDAFDLFPMEIRWSRLPIYEKEDNTTGSQEFACAGGNCEL